MYLSTVTMWQTCRPEFRKEGWQKKATLLYAMCRLFLRNLEGSTTQDMAKTVPPRGENGGRIKAMWSLLSSAVRISWICSLEKLNNPSLKGWHRKEQPQH